MLPLTSVVGVGRHRQCRHRHRVSTFIGPSCSQFVVYINYCTETHAANLGVRQQQ